LSGSAFAQEILPAQQFDRRREFAVVAVVEPLDLANLAKCTRITRPLRRETNEFDVAWVTVRGADNGIEVADRLWRQIDSKLFSEFTLER
jgi:hypothetical protein